MAHHSVLIMIKSINCRENSLRCRPHSSFFKKFSDCDIFKAFPEPKSIFDNVAYGPKLHGLARDKYDLKEMFENSLHKAGLLG